MDTKQSEAQQKHQDHSYNTTDMLPYDSIEIDNPLYQVAQFYKGCALVKLSLLTEATICFNKVQPSHNFYDTAQSYIAQCLFNEHKFHDSKATLSNIDNYEIYSMKVQNLINVCEGYIESLELFCQPEHYINIQEAQGDNYEKTELLDSSIYNINDNTGIIGESSSAHPNQKLEAN